MIPSKVLLIDDDDDLRRVAALSMRKVAGWEVITANSGAEGLELALEHHPDLTLLDVMMPEMDGPMTLAAMRADARLAQHPVIFITARIQSSEIAELMALGVAGVIRKPFNPITLAEEVSRLVEAK